MSDILERLTDYLAKCPSANGRTFHENQEEVLIAHSADEIVKLRSALREVVINLQSVPDHPYSALEIARAALEGKNDG